jgi:hypothetical protein
MSIDWGIGAGSYKSRCAVFNQEVALGALEIFDCPKVCDEDLPTFDSEVVWLNIFMEMPGHVYFYQCIEHLHCYLRNDKVIVDANLLLFSDVLIN